MTPRKRTLRFVDDDLDEVSRFCQIMATGFIIGRGTSLDTALENLRSEGDSLPNLYVLDSVWSESLSKLRYEVKFEIRPEKLA